MDAILSECAKRHEEPRLEILTTVHGQCANQLNCELLIGNIHISVTFHLKTITAKLSWLYAIKSIFTSSVSQVVKIGDLIHKLSLQLCSNSEAQFGVIERLHKLSTLMNLEAYKSKRYCSEYKAKEATKNAEQFARRTNSGTQVKVLNRCQKLEGTTEINKIHSEDAI